MEDKHDSNKEIVRLLTEISLKLDKNVGTQKESILLVDISSKLDKITDNKEDKQFQIDMLLTQIKVNNIFSFMTVAISICMSFLAAYFSLAFTENIPPELSHIVPWFVFLLIIGVNVSFFISWIIANRVIVGSELGYLKKTYGTNEETDKKSK
jgi:hypothetical protein